MPQDRGRAEPGVRLFLRHRGARMRHGLPVLAYWIRPLRVLNPSTSGVLLDHQQTARSRINANLHRSSKRRKRCDSLSCREGRQTVPKAFSDPADRVLQAIDDTGVTHLVKNPVVYQTDYLVRQVLGQLCDEHQPEPAFPASARTARNLLEEDL